MTPDVNLRQRGGVMRSRQQGVSIKGLIFWLATLGFITVIAAKMLPYYNEYYSVKKIFAGMEQAGDLNGSVREIRYAFEKRNAIEDVKSVRGEDLEIVKEGGSAVVTAAWSVRVPIAGNVSACIDFMVTTAK
jgi:hypothetical protein